MFAGVWSGWVGWLYIKRSWRRHPIMARWFSTFVMMRQVEGESFILPVTRVLTGCHPDLASIPPGAIRTTLAGVITFFPESTWKRCGKNLQCSTENSCGHWSHEQHRLRPQFAKGFEAGSYQAEGEIGRCDKSWGSDESSASSHENSCEIQEIFAVERSSQERGDVVKGASG